jgi:CYTH domain-containing protein
MLKKTRYFVNVDDLTYEVNIFDDIMFAVFPLIIIELEMESPTLVIDKLPAFCGQEVTQDERFYGYNLFKCLKDTTEFRLEKPYKNNVVQFRKILDKNE